MQKTNQPTANKRSSMKTIVSALKHRVTVKQLTACSTEQLLVFNNSPILLGVPGKKTSRGHPHSLGDCLILDPCSPPNFRFPPWGRGVWIFSGTTQFDFKVFDFGLEKLPGLSRGGLQDLKIEHLRCKCLHNKINKSLLTMKSGLPP